MPCDPIRAASRAGHDAVANRYRIGAVASTALLLLASSTLPALAASSGTAQTGTQVEGWYSTLTSDACEPPAELDCSMLPAASVYPAETLHVGVASGKPSALTVIELDLFGAKIPPGAEVVGGTLLLPVDTSQSDGSLQPDTAKLIVCHVTDFFTGTEGSLAKPPKTDCDGASTPARYVAEPRPVFIADLNAFAAKWTAGDTPALAILPAPEAVSENKTWHVTFWGKDYSEGAEGGDAVPITAKLNYQAKAGDFTTSPTVETSTDLGPPELGELVAPPPAQAELDVKESAPVAGAPSETAPPPQAAVEAAPSLRTFGYPYPIAWMMPLLLLIGFGVTGRALTKNLEPSPGTRPNW